MFCCSPHESRSDWLSERVREEASDSLWNGTRACLVSCPCFLRLLLGEGDLQGLAGTCRDCRVVTEWTRSSYPPPPFSLPSLPRRMVNWSQSATLLASLVMACNGAHCGTHWFACCATWRPLATRHRHQLVDQHFRASLASKRISRCTFKDCGSLLISKGKSGPLSVLHKEALVAETVCYSPLLIASSRHSSLERLGV